MSVCETDFKITIRLENLEDSSRRGKSVVISRKGSTLQKHFSDFHKHFVRDFKLLLSNTVQK